MGWELAFLHWLEQFRGGMLELFLVFYTHLGDNGLMFLFISALLLCFKRTRRAGILGFIALAIGALTTNVVLKHLVSRQRPYVTDPSLVPLIFTNDMNSFPSGHSTAAFASATAWFMGLGRRCRWRAALFALPLLMAFSRMYVGVHYPTDVLAGLLIGVAAGLLAYLLWRWLRERWNVIESLDEAAEGR